jgi:hypothetical protein
MARGNGAGTVHEQVPDAARARMQAMNRRFFARASDVADAIAHPIQSFRSRIMAL